MDQSNRVPENGSMRAIESVVFEQQPRLNVFDLMKVGLSSTFAIIIFIGVGYVVKHVAGPSAILSILIAAFIAYLVGTFYTELNGVIVLSTIKTPVRLSQVVVVADETMAVGQSTNDLNAYDSTVVEWLLPSHTIVTYINGEFAAFVIAWNLIMEYMVIVALISKALIIFIDALFFDSSDHFHLTQIVPMSWYLSEHFDGLALLVPIVIGVPLLLLLGRHTIFNTVSIALSLVITVIFLFFSIFNADIKNWNYNPVNFGDDDTAADDNVENLTIQTGGFYMHGINGVFKGVVIILFTFVAFDAMIISPWATSIWFSRQHTTAGDTKPMNIEHFTKTITQAILSINTVIFLCCLGMAFALTTIQPVHSMDGSLPLLSVINVVYSDSNEMCAAARFIILIAGFIALVGSLYAILHAVQRVVHTMLSDDGNDSTFKLFGKFGLNHFQPKEIRQQYHDNDQTTIEHNNNRTNGTESNRRWKNQQRWQMYACLILFSILSGLLAGLFAIEHLINILSIGTLLMLFALTIDIMILRYCGRLKQRLQHPHENATSTTGTKSMRSINLVTILLSSYCLLAAILAILIKIIMSNDPIISTMLCWIFISILIASLLVIVFVLGIQPNGNAIFSFNFKHPFLPAIILFCCIFLFTAFEAIAWIRFAIWTTIGLILYFIALKHKPSPKTTTTGVINNGFAPESELNQNKYADTMTASFEIVTWDDVDNSSIGMENATVLNQEPNVANPRQDEWKPIQEIKNFETQSFELDELTNGPIEELDATPVAKSTQRSNGIDHSKLDEISSVDDIKDTCIERREPNGTIYFVEMFQNSVENDRNKSESPVQNGQYIEEHTGEFEKNMHDRVLNQTIVDNQRDEPKSLILPVPFEFEDIESEEEKEVRAIVHVSSDNSSQFESLSLNELPIESDPSLVQHEQQVKLNNSNVELEQSIRENSIPKSYSAPTDPLTPTEITTHPGIIRSINSTEKQRRTPNFQIGIYEALPKQKLLYENDENRLAFKMRLENLFGQIDDVNTTRTKSNLNSPIIPHALRVSSLSHSISAPESLVDEGINPMKVIPAKIPIPPAFNQELYNTIGHRNRKVFSSVSDVIDMNGTPNDHASTECVNKKASLSRTKAHENLAELDALENDGDDTSTHTIKQKLEEIFSKGRTVQPNDMLDAHENNNSEINNRRRTTKQIGPFDTVRKQKMLFSDVLKSIGPDIHANLHPTHTTAAIDTQVTQRRESLD